MISRRPNNGGISSDSFNTTCSFAFCKDGGLIAVDLDRHVWRHVIGRPPSSKPLESWLEIQHTPQPLSIMESMSPLAMERQYTPIRPPT